MARVRTIDSHTHILTEEAMRLLGKESPKVAPVLKNVTQAGGIICPATPSFYSLPRTIDEVAATVVDRVLDIAGLDISTFRWGS